MLAHVYEGKVNLNNTNWYQTIHSKRTQVMYMSFDIQLVIRSEYKTQLHNMHLQDTLHSLYTLASERGFSV